MPAGIKARRRLKKGSVAVKQKYGAYVGAAPLFFRFAQINFHFVAAFGIEKFLRPEGPRVLQRRFVGERGALDKKIFSVFCVKKKAQC